MELRIYDPRIIAIDLRFRRSGFATFEGPRRLLDFGTLDIRLGEGQDGRSRLSELMKLAAAKVVLVKRERWNDLMTRPDAKPLIDALTNQATAHSIQIRFLEQSALDSTFRNLGCETKADISASLARIFPELIWKLPPERRIWEPEHSRQTVFDAIALGKAFWQNESNSIETPKEQSEILEDCI
jgi:hypothetical protein